MQMRSSLVLTMSLIVVAMLLQGRAASAQGSPTIPTGGGSAHEITNLGDDTDASLKTTLRFPHGLGVRGYFTPALSRMWGDRPTIAASRGRQASWQAMRPTPIVATKRQSR
jgi:hypothetical protein